MMTKILLNLVLVMAILFASGEAAAQSDNVPVTRKAELQTLSENLQKRDDDDRQQVEEIAFRMGIPVRRELSNGGVLELQRIAPGIGPIFYITYNVDAADTVSTDEVWPGGSAGLDLDGGGMTVGEWDGGAVYAAHPDFIGRLTQVDGATLVSNHSTHVAGTLVGSGEGLLAESRGMAYAAHLDAYDWNSDTAEMAVAAANGLLISNHSYGIAAGWLFLGGAAPDNWWWIGGADPSDVEDPNFGYYDSETQLWDQIAIDAPFYLIVKAAGNDRSDIGPSPGELYTVIDQDGQFLFTSTLPRNADCAPAGYDCMPGSSVAKNVLTVGAVDDIIGGYSPFSGPSSVQMADFSGWGPTDDGRIKPDVVGNGIFLLSAWGDEPYYAAAAGTSMAAPNVTGSLLLLQELYEADPDAGYTPDMMDYDGSTGYYSKSHISAGNKQTLVARVNITEGTAAASQFIAAASGAGAFRAAILIVDGNHPKADLQNTITFVVWNSAGSVITRLASQPGVSMAGAEHTIFAAYDGDAGTAVLVIDGEDGDYASHPNRVAPATATLAIGSGVHTVGATPSGSRLLDGEIGFVGMSEAYLTNWADFFDVDGNPKELDETTWTEWGTQPLFWNEDGDMNVNAGFAGNMTRNGTITPVDYSSPGTGIFMRAATLKALAIHTADEAGAADGPDYEFGWGLLNTKAAAQVITENGGAHQIIEDSLLDGAVDAVEIIVSEADTRITATVVWADPPGTPVAPTLDPPDLMLVNDLDLRIKSGPSTYMPWILNPASPAAAAATGDNFRDNVEQVVIDGAGAGSYFVEVSHKGTLLNGDAQNYSLIISVEPSLPTSSTLLIDEDFSAGLPAGWSVDTVRGVSWTINVPVPGDSRLDNLTGGAGNFAMVNNNFSHKTVTSLITPSFNLSSAVAVVLRFKSRFNFDTFETINVDSSTDGGTSWTNVWQFLGFNPFPTTYVLDLSGVGAGQANFKLRFRFDSQGDIQGDFWQIDDVEFEVFWSGPPPASLPGPASNPDPADTATTVSIASTLGWTAGSDTDSHEVYFGASSPPAPQGTQVGSSFAPGPLAYSTTYYWRIDEVNAEGTTTGTEWSFTTEADPEIPYTPGMMEYDGSTEHYSKSHVSAGNKQTLVARVNITEGSAAASQFIAAASGAGAFRAAILIVDGNHPKADLQNTINFVVWNSAGSVITRLATQPGLSMAGAEHTIFAAYDGDAGTAILVIDGEDGDYASHPNRVAPATATLATGSGVHTVGATPSGSRLLDGEIGFVGMSEAYLTNWADFFDVDGNPKELDETTWTEWVAQPLFWNADGDMEVNAGSAGNMTKHGTITPVDYSPDMMDYDGSTGYYSKSHISAGNKQTLVARVNITEGTAAASQFIAAASGAGAFRAAILIVDGNHPKADLQNTITFVVWNSAGSVITRLASQPGVSMAGAEHTIFAAYDGDAGTAVLVIDGEDGDYASHPNRVAPATATLAIGSGVHTVGATPSGSRLLDGEIGFVGMSEAYLTNWADFFDVDGNPKELDETTWTEWGAQPLFWNDDGDMEVNAGSAGNMTKHGTITRVDY